jgi:aminoglycoside phosphotransferase (APT) family kinase protein
MHDGEVDIDAGLVGRLVAAQFPALGGLPVRAVQSTGTVNAIYRLGDHLYARLPRLPSWALALESGHAPAVRGQAAGAAGPEPSG